MSYLFTRSHRADIEVPHGSLQAHWAQTLHFLPVDFNILINLHGCKVKRVRERDTRDCFLTLILDTHKLTVPILQSQGFCNSAVEAQITLYFSIFWGEMHIFSVLLRGKDESITSRILYD